MTEFVWGQFRDLRVAEAEGFHKGAENAVGPIVGLVGSSLRAVEDILWRYGPAAHKNRAGDGTQAMGKLFLSR